MKTKQNDNKRNSRGICKTKEQTLLHLLRNLKRVGNGGIQHELSLFLQKKIEEGVLKEGDRLPSLRKLADAWNTNLFSAKLATDELVRLGLLNKQHGRGMFVAPRTGKIFRAGIYTSSTEPCSRDFMSFAMIHEITCRRLHELGIEYEIWSDYRPKEEHSEPPKAVTDAVISGRIQAVIGVVVRNYDTWFSRLPIKKVSIMGDRQIHSRCEEIAGELKKRGSRRVGAIVPVNSDGWSFIVEEFRTAGIRFRKNNVKALSEAEILAKKWSEIGYCKTMELLTAHTRPDTLIVYPDNAVQGAIQAILELGIRVPEELTVVFHRNLELGYFCPFPAFYIDSSLTAIAERLVAAATGENRRTEKFPALMKIAEHNGKG